MWVSFLNFERGSEVSLLNFEEGSWGSTSKPQGSPGSHFLTLREISGPGSQFMRFWPLGPSPTFTLSLGNCNSEPHAKRTAHNQHKLLLTIKTSYKICFVFFELLPSSHSANGIVNNILAGYYDWNVNFMVGSQMRSLNFLFHHLI